MRFDVVECEVLGQDDCGDKRRSGCKCGFESGSSV